MRTAADKLYIECDNSKMLGQNIPESNQRKQLSRLSVAWPCNAQLICRNAASKKFLYASLYYFIFLLLIWILCITPMAITIEYQMDT